MLLSLSLPFDLKDFARLSLASIELATTSMRQFFITASNSPALEELTPEDIAFPSNRLQHPSTGVISLPRMRSSTTWTLIVLTRLMVSPSAHINIRVFAPHDIDLRDITPRSVARLASIKSMRHVQGPSLCNRAHVQFTCQY
ncbi:hypothetical protein BOTBODRAFT_188145 [Botryobasidium botryosum FD-172 SS1]|uniref:Uncharacterized protein n=1 Tax=Botryobasidium botryosum (strain FD-172 SS1) TaxID=930990 RepID=A0A067MQU9_BOTB1|nr:hypothetical protein BOTBODRAFT_188145 [Botryobasidium botryosum FD-172 SS1]